MYKKQGKNLFKHFDFILLDLVCSQLAYIIAFEIRHGTYLPYLDPLYRDMAPVLVLIGLIVATAFGGYSGILRRGYFKEFAASIKYVSIVIVSTLTYMFFIQNSQAYSRITFMLMWAINIFIVWVVRIIYKKILIKLISGRVGRRSLIVVSSFKNLEPIVERIKKAKYEDIKITGLVAIDQNAIGQSVSGVDVVAGRDNIIEYLKTSWVDEIFIDLNNNYEEYLLNVDLVSKCMEMGIATHTRLHMIEEISSQQVVEKLAGYSVLSNSISMVTPSKLMAKRFMDILGGIFGCIIAGIATIFVGPIIYIKSPGPIFFKQTRVGKNGKTFEILKFRSMYMDAEERKQELMEQNKMESGMMFKIDDDPRIIKGIGSFIRKFSIDELPQFWNILVGDMSLVGTRPPTVDEWEKYELHHRKRLAIKPGLTGMWQVSGRSNIVDFEQVVELDTKYIAEWSLLLDIKIILKTIKVVLCKEGSV